jgi:hypothetical protein
VHTTRAAIAELFNSGLTIPVIARQLDLAPTTVCSCSSGSAAAYPSGSSRPVAAALTARLALGDRSLRRLRPQLHAALYGRTRAAIRNWLGEATPRLELEMIPPRHRPSIVEDKGVLRVRLPFRWILDVAARELSTVFGRFCLSAATDNGVDWKLVTIGPDLAAPQIVTIELPRP